jgi:hypothetical protein
MKTSRKNKSGSRADRFLKSFGDTLSRRAWFLDSQDLCVIARRRMGLEDFGEPPVEPVLALLVSSLESEADLHPLGRFLMRIHLRGLLETRLQLAREWNTPCCKALSAVVRPIFITGMPRSGSTFLHELLGQAPALRAPRVWEVMFPSSATHHADQGRFDFRVWKAATCLWLFRRLARKADAVYPIRARMPHECVAIHSYTFLSEEFISTCHIPSYEAFLRSADLRPAYQFQKRLLQHLQVGNPAARWVLKSPDHVHSLEALFSVFPDALIIQTHRHPLQVIRSSVQLTEVLQGLYGRPRTLEELSEREARNLATAMDGLMRFRDNHPELADRFVDVEYSELTTNPVAVVRRILEYFQLGLAAQTISRVHQLARSRSAYRGRRRISSLLGQGQAVTEQRTLFREYCQRFGIPFEHSGLT